MRTHRVSICILATLIAFVSGCAPAAAPTAIHEVWSGDDIATRSSFDQNARYIIYLHGKILEDEGLDAVHPEHGRYEYLETLSYLASTGGQIISEIRPAETYAYEYAETVTGWITRLLDAGVPPQNISVVGFSKGAFIALLVSDMLENPHVNFVVIAICGDWILLETDIRLSGRVLSLFETSDDYGGSCRGLVERSPGVSDFEEISHSTGEGHGAFYQAEPFWLDDVVGWITGVD
jgi:hypothetical protein